MEVKPDPSTQRRTLAALLAYALTRVFPAVQLLEIGPSPLGYQCRFVCDQPLGEAQLSLVEEKMGALRREGMELKQVEMLPSNAAELFGHLHQPFLAEAVLEQEGLASLCQIGGLYVPVGRSTSPDLTELPFFKLLHLRDEGEVFEIEGIFAPSKADLKARLKAIKAWSSWDYRVWGPKLGLVKYEADGWDWGPRGGAFHEILRAWWCQQHSIPDYWPAPDGEHDKLFIELRDRFEVLRVCTWALDGDEVSLFCPPDQALSELISSLHFLKKTVNILGFEPHIHQSPGGFAQMGTKKSWNEGVMLVKKALKEAQLEALEDADMEASLGPRLEFRVRDCLGRDWTLASLDIDLSLPSGSGLVYDTETSCSPVVLRRSAFSSLERCLALLLESHQARLPLSLAPIQIRVLSKEPSCVGYAMEVMKALRDAGWRSDGDFSEEELKPRVYAALEEGVARILVVGPREKERQTVSFRDKEGRTQRNLPLTTFLEGLVQEGTLG